MTGRSEKRVSFRCAVREQCPQCWACVTCTHLRTLLFEWEGFYVRCWSDDDFGVLTPCKILGGH